MAKRPPLEIALDDRDYKKFKELLDKGADKDLILTGDSPGPIICKAAVNSPDFLDLLIGKGANLEARNESGETALFVAAGELYNEDAIKALIKAGADLNAQDEEGVTPLTKAVAELNVDAVKSLIDAGADITIHDNQNGTTLFHALLMGKSEFTNEIVLLLVKAGAKLADHDAGLQVELDKYIK